MVRSALPLAVCLALAAPAHAYKFSGQRWPDSAFPFAWFIDKNGADNITDGTDVSEVARAAQAWTDVTCSKVAFGTPDTSQHFANIEADDNQNKVGWIESHWQYGQATLGVTTPKFYPPPGGDNEIFDADIVFNGQDYQWYAATPARGLCSNCTDVFSIALHEEGHFFGLAHSDKSTAVMYASYDGDAKQTLTQDDIDAACALYNQPVPHSGTQGQSCTAQIDCAGGLSCLKSTDMVANICTKECTAQNPTCPTGLSCQDDTAAGKACFVPPAPTGDLCHACNSGSDCDTGICIYTGTSGICSRACHSPTDCPTVNGQVLKCYGFQDSTATACLPETQTCNNNCSATVHCPTGQTCTAGTCVFAAAGPDAACPTGLCQTGYTCLTINDEVDPHCRKNCSVASQNCADGFTCYDVGNNLGVCYPSLEPPVLGHQGDACNDTSKKCDAGFWCKAFGSGSAVCVQDCNPNANNCAGQFNCNQWDAGGVPSGSQGGYCYGPLVTPKGAKRCEVCGTGVGDCVENQQLFCTPGPTSASCRTGCHTDADCGSGGSCETRGGVPGFAGVCRCGAAPKNDGETCVADQDCATGLLCIVDASSSGAVCRKSCATASPDCPEARTCQDLGSAAFCLPPADQADAGTSNPPGSTNPCGQCASQNPVGLAVLALGALAMRRRRARA